MAVKNTLFQYWKNKELEKGKLITIANVATATGLHHETVKNLLLGKTTRFDMPVLDKVCQFFNMPPGPIPFIIFEPDNANEPTKEPAATVAL